MFSVSQKREIADKVVQDILRATNHPELLPKADIQNNGAITNPNVNPWNELQDPKRSLKL